MEGRAVIGCGRSIGRITRMVDGLGRGVEGGAVPPKNKVGRLGSGRW